MKFALFFYYYPLSFYPATDKRKRNQTIGSTKLLKNKTTKTPILDVRTPKNLMLVI
jgi:hypothetical protein